MLGQMLGLNQSENMSTIQNENTFTSLDVPKGKQFDTLDASDLRVNSGYKSQNKPSFDPFKRSPLALASASRQSNLGAGLKKSQGTKLLKSSGTES